MSTGGLQRGSEDFKLILQRFKNNIYRPSTYNAEAIRNSNPAWQAKYQPRPFAESLRNLVAVASLARPPKPAQATSATAPPNQAPAYHQQEEDEDITMDAPEGYAPPGTASVPSGHNEVGEHHLICTPKHVIAWVDSSSNQNNRITVYIMMPPGHNIKHYKLKVEGGREVVLKYTWPEEMLTAKILNKGHDMYEEGHNKLTAMESAIKALRNNDDANPVISDIRVALPFTCEEQLTKLGVPGANYTTSTDEGLKILSIELMGYRTNYQTQRVAKHYDSPRPMQVDPPRDAEARRRAAEEESARAARAADMARRRQEAAEKERRHQEAADMLRRRQEQAAEMERLRQEVDLARQHEKQQAQEQAEQQQETERRMQAQMRQWLQEQEQQQEQKMREQIQRMQAQQAEAMRLKSEEVYALQQRLQQQTLREPTSTLADSTVPGQGVPGGTWTIVDGKAGDPSDSASTAMVGQAASAALARQAAADAAASRAEQQQKQQQSATSLQRASQQGKQLLLNGIASASIRHRARWTLALANNHSNVESSRESLGKSAEEADRKQKFKNQPSAEALRTDRQDKQMEKSHNKRNSKLNTQRLSGGSPLQGQGNNGDEGRSGSSVTTQY